MQWIKRGLIGLVVAALLLWVAINLFKAQVGKRVFARAASEAIARDVIGDLEDGLHVILIGSGSPFGDPTRAGPSTAIIAGNRVFIVDAGSGSPRNLAAFGIPGGAIERVFLTHFHSDHIDSLGELMLQRWAGGGHAEPLPIHGPVGVTMVVDGFNLAYRLDQGYRVSHHGETIVPPSGFGGTAIPFQRASTQVVFDDGDVRVTAFEVSHDPIEPAVGYRFDYKGRSVTLSGDTAYSDVLIAHAENTDILICEALNAEMVGVLQAELTERGNTNLAQIMADIPGYHMSPTEAATTAAEADARLLVLNHIVPALPSPFLNAAFKQGTGRVYEGTTIVGQDGMMFSALVGETRIRQRRLD